MRDIKYIVIHCSDNLPTQDIGVAELRVLHTTPPPRGKGWKDVGYHYVIRRNGRIETGRALSVAGAHVENYNAHSIGLCLAGGRAQISPPKYAANFSDEQWAALKTLVADLKKQFPKAKIMGHRDYPGVHKDCPCFDAGAGAAQEGLA
jgi:N-acetyl-anhydromuramyl-L-alanine amidase AmpD